MRILVTGVAGFIGSHLTDRLLELGHEVIGIDNFNDYYNPLYKEENIATALKHPKFTLHRVDICDQAEVERIVQTQHIDTVIHLAAQAGVRISIQQPMRAYKNNVEGTLVVFEAARKAGIHDIIYASSSSVYGNQPTAPFSETLNVDNPISPYAATKKANELLAHTYHHLYKMNMTGLRFFTVYGERGRPDMSPYLFADAIVHDRPIAKFGDGTSLRDFTYVADIVSGIVACMQKNLGYQIFNLGNSQPITLNAYIATFERVTAKKALIDQKPMQPGDVFMTAADTAKAQSMLGWHPTTSLEQGLTRFIQWFKIHRL
ncbi:MAG: GDP-mannose 4,6-dehydratase [Candidatus Kerfeldbacteria bacterium]|nr:GDP-mannose 4,6-dehydratase [Candidatus Kerfeldbacteria bacterium]